ncbi:MAG: gfo/Idh/MocA family oxidoreductase [Marinilabiliales bacterium]|nr:MAG: gfo/Idh/MocA family oxidoreductase [Marinilabiliales bacterium]
MENKSQKKAGRREFLRLSALGAAGLFTAPAIGALSATPESTFRKEFPGILTGNHKRVGIALVGLGYYSTDILAPALQETEIAYLAGIVTGTRDNEQVWKEKYNIPRENIYNYENFDEIAHNRDIDIVYVVLPNSMHKEFTIRAANAGKHVICEKPMAMNAEECREMIDACRSNNVGLSIGYRMQYEPYTQEIMRLGQDKVFGNVRHITCGAAWRNTNFDHWKWEREMGGGAMMDMGVYPLQAARYVTGEEPLLVSAQTFVTRPGKFEGVDEVTSFQLEFPGGTIATLDTGFHANYNHLYAFAEKGWFELRPFSAYSGISGRTSAGELNFPEINQQAAQMDEDAANMMAGRPVRVPGEEGMKDMIVVDAIFESISTRRNVILG